MRPEQPINRWVEFFDQFFHAFLATLLLRLHQNVDMRDPHLIGHMDHRVDSDSAGGPRLGSMSGPHKGATTTRVLRCLG